MLKFQKLSLRKKQCFIICSFESNVSFSKLVHVINISGSTMGFCPHELEKQKSYFITNRYPHIGWITQLAQVICFLPFQLENTGREKIERLKDVCFIKLHLISNKSVQYSFFTEIDSCRHSAYKSIRDRKSIRREIF